ncbi:RimJ/RimL family protein N-acetyltransferase [Ulvibacter sp. MAR_2010_11]|uniref:GNAT family N-acetyltransferase n=1 Tax=Ulvibacter sp. MAR_2010_11 TaxID=1250229 RepID=UPI000C2CD41B|nr:GNAT family protein [Ulvibacter sp. MAR_2010_11]PKA82034.1 RimJ/RimL family protein N-acetyltransferase [Ulvibacter sp. MAR_2010_11]
MIHFENYTIRPLELDDLVPYFNLVERNRKRLEDFFTGTVSKTKDLDATRIFLAEIIEKRQAKQYFPYLLVDNVTNEFVAFFDLKNVDWTIPKTEVGCYTDEKFAGKGLTSEAIKLFIEYCFKHFEFKKIYLRTHHSNKAAQHLAEKCGFEKEGTIRMDYITTSGEIVDLIYYGRIQK